MKEAGLLLVGENGHCKFFFQWQDLGLLKYDAMIELQEVKTFPIFTLSEVSFIDLGFNFSR